MKKYLRRGSQILALLIVCSVALLYLTRSHAVLLRIYTGDSIRPRNYCVLNPFRDKAPEKLAQEYLNRLREGAVEAIAPFVAERKDIPEKERQWPVQSWRIGDRKNTADGVAIMYWVERGGGYAEAGYEEAVFFWMTRSGEGWQVNTYSAVY